MAPRSSISSSGWRRRDRRATEPSRSLHSATTARRRCRGTGHERDRDRRWPRWGTASAAATFANGPCWSACVPPVSRCTSDTTGDTSPVATAVTASTAVPANNIELDEASKTGIAVLTRAGMLSSICAQAKSLGVAGTHGKTTTTSMLMLILAGRRTAAVVHHRRRRDRHGHRCAMDRRRVVGRRGRRERRHPSRAAAVRHDPDQRRGRPSRLLRHRRGDRRRVRAVPRPDRRAEGVVHRRPGLCRARRAARRDHVRNVAGCRLPRRRHSCRSRLVQLHRRNGPERHSAPSICRCAAFTTCATHWVPWRWLAPSVSTSMSPLGHWPSSAASPGVSISAASMAARRWSTTTPTCRARSARCCRRRAGSGDGWRRVVAVFQPNRFNRMAVMSPAYRDAFVDADLVVITDIYPSGTTPIPGVTGKLVVNAVLDAHPSTRMAWMPRRNDLIDYLAQRTPRRRCLHLDGMRRHRLAPRRGAATPGRAQGASSR